MNFNDYNGKFTMPKTGRKLNLSIYQEEIIDALIEGRQTIYYRSRMGNSTAMIYYLFVSMLETPAYKICYIGSNDESVAKFKEDFEKYLSYNLSFLTDKTYYTDDKGNISFDNESIIEFYTPDTINKAASDYNKVICENYVFQSNDEKQLEAKLNKNIQYVLEN